MSARPFAWMSALIAATGCQQTAPLAPPQGQILLYVDTDAPVPEVQPDPAANPTPPLFDTVRFEIYAPGESTPCDGCTNERAVYSDQLRATAASVGIAPPAGVSGYRVLVRLFHQPFVSASGDVPPGSTLEMVVALPAVEATGIVEVTAKLMTDTVGQPVGTLASPVAPVAGRPTSSLVGTWPGASPVPCATTAPEGMVCVPGGAYWMGNPNAYNVGDMTNATIPRLVALSPFFMDAKEVTVADFRAAKMAPKAVWSGGTTGSALQDWCTFSTTPGPFENEPVSCVMWDEARGYCQARGADLPSEAQYEYAASALQGKNYVWGSDSPLCGDAVYGRTGYGLLELIDSLCVPPVGPGGPLPAGSGTRDRLELPGSDTAIVDLAGNVSEWVLDDWNRQEEPCWSRQGLYTDPLCTEPSPADGLIRFLRGSDWLAFGGDLQAALRENLYPSTVFLPELGFRCVKKGVP